MTREKPEQPVDDEGRPIEPGDFVIELRDGVPYVHTVPEGNDSEET